MSEIITRTTCRLCQSPHLVDLFSLGEQYVSAFVDKEDVTTCKCKTCDGVGEVYYGNDGYGVVGVGCGDCEEGRVSQMKCPINLVLCQGCTLVQLRHTAPPEFMYSKHYWFKSGTTKTLRQQLRDITSEVEWQIDLQPDDVVVDIGANDSTMLRTYTKSCFKVAIDPAKNLVQEGSEGVDLHIQGFWPLPLARYTGGRKAKVITAIGMMYDAEDPTAFVQAVAENLAPDGIFIAQLMCLKNMLNQNDVGNLCHEHLLYFSFQSLKYLFSQCGLEMYDIETNDTNGESYRLYVRHEGSNAGMAPDGEINLMTVEMSEKGLDRYEFYKEFFWRMDDNRQEVVSYLKDCKSQGKRIWLLGASTKMNTVLQFYGLDYTLIDAAAERTPEKVGKYTVGTGIPIRSEEDFRLENPDIAIIGPFAFSQEIMKREAEWKKSDPNHVFLIPLPSMRIM